MLKKFHQKMLEWDPYAKKVSAAEYHLATDAGLVVVVWLLAGALMLLSITKATASNDPTWVSRGGTIWIAWGVMLTVRDIDRALRLAISERERNHL